MHSTTDFEGPHYEMPTVWRRTIKTPAVETKGLVECGDHHLYLRLSGYWWFCPDRVLVCGDHPQNTAQLSLILMFRENKPQAERQSGERPTR